jgi:integrase
MARRKSSYGLGTVYRRTDGRWCGQVMIGGRRRTVYGRKESEVTGKLKDLLADEAKGILPPDSKPTLAEWLPLWLDGVAGTVEPGTLSSYRQIARLYLLPDLGHRRILDITPSELRRHYAAMVKRGLSATTVQHTHAVLRPALRQAVADGLLSRSPAEGLRLPSAKGAERTVLGPEHVTRMLEEARGTRLHPYLSLAVLTGMRPGELLALRWGDVDLDAASVTVRRARKRDGSIGATKTARSRRRIDLPEIVVRSLRVHRMAMLEARIAAGSEWRDTNLVFTTWTGGMLHPRNLTRAFKALLRRADVPDIRLYDLRHTNATLLLLRNIPARVVSERLGHANINLTLDTYTHVLPTMGKDAARELDDLLD